MVLQRAGAATAHEHRINDRSSGLGQTWYTIAITIGTSTTVL
jgi:hypothetical protein